MNAALKKPYRSQPRAPRLLSRILMRFLAAEAAYRQARKLAEMPPERLHDMGICAEEKKAPA